MRLCFELDLETPAVELIKDQNLRGFFSDSTSFHILMTMLFKKGHYKSALEVLAEMKKQGIPFNKETYLLAFAICYKLEIQNLLGSDIDCFDDFMVHVLLNAF